MKKVQELWLDAAVKKAERRVWRKMSVACSDRRGDAPSALPWCGVVGHVGVACIFSCCPLLVPPLGADKKENP